MASRAIPLDSATMASPWRRRSLCVLTGAGETIVALRRIDGRGAIVEIHDGPPLGIRVLLGHPDAGTIVARVSALMEGAIWLEFELPDAAVPFALAAIVGDMTRP